MEKICTKCNTSKDIVLFSKNKTYQPTKLIYEELKHGDQDDSRIVSVIGWRD